ncbi:MAG TPA: NUDIX domain-containing protein [Mycobacteriales bacterium]|nr:NUDIX domain-containing protein [Mycobacteriales bacterium]
MTVPVRDAATVMLVRDGSDGLEVFMVRRSLRLVFAGGAHVFPGGAVDAVDRQMERWCVGRTDEDASATLGVARGGLAFWVAAVRECFEEAGFLLAVDANGEFVRLDDPESADRFAAHRQAVTNGTRSLADVCAAEGLRLAVDSMQYVSRWITPEGSPRRFDTRFFVCTAPERQTPLHDATETIAHEWVRPGDVLDRHRQGEVDLMTPTRRSLQWLEGEASVANVLATAAGSGPGGQYQRG